MPLELAEYASVSDFLGLRFQFKIVYMFFKETNYQQPQCFRELILLKLEVGRDQNPCVAGQ